MTKKEYIEALDQYLVTMSASEKADILSDYEEHFRVGLENGKTESQIAASLGSPYDVANQFLEAALQAAADQQHGEDTEHRTGAGEGILQESPRYQVQEPSQVQQDEQQQRIHEIDHPRGAEPVRGRGQPERHLVSQ